ncbi:F0F1 ATP synthase subunit B [Leptospira sp. GIMC2001]|uniref:F0F1 ATP synthase subunit B n=1 Tax=Leptospira sp. GIMC2001 TaxID=1513297 RepID=UPI00234A8EB9|nr:F0F1 ATP synthase subunit B [Leptospira sp. GIMC2001]WCL48928.1 F0F1 ATP synthase subunit B [Leptospira sp. GIMC2001]
MVFLGAGGGLNLLDVNPGLVIWTLVTFLIVVFILKKFAWDKILTALDERAAGIESEIEKATSLRSDAEKVLRDYQEKVNHAKDEALAIINEAKSDAVNLKNKMIEDANSDIRKLKEQSVRDIELAKAKAVQELQIQVAEMSVLIASEILEKQLKKDDYASFIDKELSKLERI